MDLVICEISLTQVRFKSNQELLDNKYLDCKRNNFFYYNYNFENLKELEKILTKVIPQLKNKEIWFTGVTLDVFT